MQRLFLAGAAVLAACTASPGPSPKTPGAFEVTRAPADAAEADRIAFGKTLLNRDWLTYPAFLPDSDGLGPTFNRISCASCHLHNGRGHPPREEGDPFTSMLLKVGLPQDEFAAAPHPAYGAQINDRAVPDVPEEGRPVLRYTSVPGSYGDGTPFELRHPAYGVEDLAFGPLGDTARLSPRVAPAIFGLGLLEGVPAKVILAGADPEDRDGDGISGRPRWVERAEDGKRMLGRFGWKAGQPDVRHQTAAALLNDMGLTTVIHPAQNCPEGQLACRATPQEETPELTEGMLADLTLYQQALLAPEPGKGQEITRGRELFFAAGCGGCHVESLPGADGRQVRAYTDLLLHDMGEGLADGLPEGGATGREWRTPPLWGLGSVPKVNDHDTLLHDGRARGAAEAILWHGGEGAAAREAFRQMPAPDRAALVAFLNSL